MAQRLDPGKKVLLMGRSGSGKSSMRSMIFENKTAADTRKLGATIEVQATPVRFLGEFTLTLWDCGGQDSYMSSYLAGGTGSRSIFSQIGGLLYIFDVESPDFSGVDMIWFGRVIGAICDSLTAAGGLDKLDVNVLVHKMDLVQEESRAKTFEAKAEEIRAKLDEASRGRISRSHLHIFGTSIWDETIYQAWSSIVQTLIPQVALLQAPLERFAKLTSACEVVIFENATLLVVARYTEFVPPPTINGGHAPQPEEKVVQGRAGARREPRIAESRIAVDERRFEKVSAVVKAFKLASTQLMSPFKSMEISHPMYTAVLDKLTDTTSILVVATDPQVQPAAIHLNIELARVHFQKLPGLSPRSR